MSDSGLPKGKDARAPTDSQILPDFFPYETRLFYRHVFDAVSEVYVVRYGMKPYEWRTMAILGSGPEMTSAEIVARSSMDKVSVSRAVSSFRRRGWLIERPHRTDSRRKVLRLSKAGLAVLDDLVPRMKEIERALLADLTVDEVADLMRLMRKVRGADQR